MTTKRRTVSSCAPDRRLENDVKIIVTYRSRFRSKRVWQVSFDLGSDVENSLAALKYAWQMGAEIIA